MYTASSEALKQYQQIGTRDAVGESSPHRLIQMMMEHALTQMNHARGFIMRNDVERKGRAIGSAISVINGLQVSLNHKANERMSANFDALYAYMMRRLLEANISNDPAMIDEVAGLMREIKEAWDAIADDPQVIGAAESGERQEDDHGGKPS
ncbi:MAG: flagellar export chaperone FliS [Pseudomonadota bacterium]